MRQDDNGNIVLTPDEYAQLQGVVNAARLFHLTWCRYSEDVASNQMELDGWSHLHGMAERVRVALGDDAPPAVPDYPLTMFAGENAPLPPVPGPSDD